MFNSEVYIENLSVHLGKTATKETDAAKEQSFTVERLIIHDDYVEGNFNNDIGVYTPILASSVCVWDMKERLCGWLVDRTYDSCVFFFFQCQPC